MPFLFYRFDENIEWYIRWSISGTLPLMDLFLRGRNRRRAQLDHFFRKYLDEQWLLVTWLQERR